MRRLFLLAVIALAALVAPACAGKKPAQNPLEYTENARREYDVALKAYFDHDWEEAKQLFEYHQEKYAEAITAYKGFVHDYPNDPEVPYARFRIAKSLFQQASPSLLLPPLEERDLASVHETYDAVRAFLQDFPGYKKTRELEYMLEVVAGLLARHELYVARFYLAENNFKAAVARCQYALVHYEGSGLEAEALVLLGETYMKMKKRKKARAVFRQMLSLYPDSPFGVPARSFLRMLGDDGAVPAAPVN
jgi:outer membrane protein assembly factor BamD